MKKILFLSLVTAAYAVAKSGMRSAEALDKAIESMCNALGVKKLIDIKDEDGDIRWETIDQAIIAVYAVAMRGMESAEYLDKAINKICKMLERDISWGLLELK